MKLSQAGVDRTFSRMDRVAVDETGCWLWLGYVARNGYGQVRVAGKTHYVHRVAYEELVGPIPDGLELDHLCRVRRCCNPDHLEPVTRLENIQRGRGPDVIRERAMARTHCRRGHEYNAQNTRYRMLPGGKKNRDCKLCAKERRRARTT